MGEDSKSRLNQKVTYYETEPIESRDNTKYVVVVQNNDVLFVEPYLSYSPSDLQVEEHPSLSDKRLKLLNRNLNEEQWGDPTLNPNIQRIAHESRKEFIYKLDYRNKAIKNYNYIVTPLIKDKELELEKLAESRDRGLVDAKIRNFGNPSLKIMEGVYEMLAKGIETKYEATIEQAVKDSKFSFNRRPTLLYPRLRNPDKFWINLNDFLANN